MDIYDQLINPTWLILGQVLFWPCVLYALWVTPWKTRSAKVKHIWPALCVGLLLLWQLKATLSLGISVHLLGATLLTVLFGWQLAIIGLTTILLGSTLITSFFQPENNYLAIGLNGISQVVIPVFFSYHFVRQVFRRLPHNFFIYIFLSGFLNASITLGLVGFASTTILALCSQLGLEQLLHHYLPAYFLIIFPEAFITGAILTIFVVYKPDWALSFDDNLYLKAQASQKDLK